MCPPLRYVISQHMTAEQYSGLYRSSDAYVIPTRGEGWGMPITEVRMGEAARKLPASGTYTASDASAALPPPGPE